MERILTLPSVPDACLTEAEIEPVRWSLLAHPDRVVPGGYFQLRLRAEVAKGYHLYSVSQPPGGPVATTITIPPDQPFSRRWPHTNSWPVPVQEFSPQFGMEIKYHIGTVMFDLACTASANVSEGRQEVLVSVLFQLCDEHTCLVPETVLLRVPVEVIARSGDDDVADGSAPEQQSEQSELEQIFSRAREITAMPEAKKRQAAFWQLAADFPNSPIPYLFLAKGSLARGEFHKAAAIYRRGLAVLPDNDRLHAELLNCATGGKHLQSARMKFVQRFPHSDRTPWVLTDMAEDAPDAAARLEFLRRAVNRGPGPTSFGTLSLLCWEIALTDPASATKHATAWLKQAEKRSANGEGSSLYERDEAKARTEFFFQLAACDRLLRLKKTKSALKAIDALVAPEIPYSGVAHQDQVLAELMRVKVLVAAGQVQRAYEQLLSTEVLLNSSKLLDTAFWLGSRLGKGRKQVEADAWQKRLSADHPNAQFEVPGPRARTITASDYQGRPLLVNVWNPG